MTVELLHKMIDAHRYLRHDFMNDIQVISGYLQIGQAEKALMYAKKTAGSMEVFNSLAKFSLPLLHGYMLSYLTLLGQGRDSFCVESEGDISGWLDLDQLLSVLIRRLLDPLHDHVSKKELKINMRLPDLPALELEFNCGDNELAGKIYKEAQVLNKEYQDKLDITINKKSATHLLLRIERKRLGEAYVL